MDSYDEQNNEEEEFSIFDNLSHQPVEASQEESSSVNEDSSNRANEDSLSSADEPSNIFEVLINNCLRTMWLKSAVHLCCDFLLFV